MCDELKPCPLCDSDNVRFFRDQVDVMIGSASAICRNCGCKATISRWNERQHKPTIAEYLARIAGLEKSLKAMAGFAEHQMNPMVNDPSSFTDEDFADLEDALKLLE